MAETNYNLNHLKILLRLELEVNHDVIHHSDEKLDNNLKLDKKTIQW